MIRLVIPPINDDDLAAVRGVLESGFLVQGANVAVFEQAIAEVSGADFGVAVSSGTAALHLALLALDTRPGDLVIVPAYSFTATANVIELCGAQPVFVDVQPDTFNLDPNRLDAAITRLMGQRETAKRVRAVLPVHTFGQMADMGPIQALASRHGLPLIEDAACALGSKLDGKPAGAWGQLGCFSFHPRKAITTGEGGLIVTDDKELAKRLRALRNHGQDPDVPPGEFIRPGFNYRMTEFQAALGQSQMRRLSALIERRRQLAATYSAMLKGSPITAPALGSKDSYHVYQSYVVLLPQETAPRRSTIMRELEEHGIQTSIGTYNMPMTTYFRTRYGYRSGDFPTADQVFARSVTLPLHHLLTDADQERVTSVLLRAGGGA